MRFAATAMVLVAALMMAGCGGGGGKSATSTPGGSSACGGPATASAGSCGSAGDPTPGQTPVAAGGQLSAASFANIPQDGETLGDPNAPVTADLYENFLCPHCRDFADAMLPQLLADYVASGKVSVRFHDVALGPPAAQLSHEAGRCAADQGKFWPAYVSLYQHFSEDESAYTKESIESWLADVGVDRAALDSCLTSGKHTQDVQASTAAFQALADTDAAYAGALATVEAAQGPAIPLLNIEGTYLTAPESYEAIRTAIEAKLAP